MNAEALYNDKKTFADAQAMLNDAMAGDPEALKLLESLNLDTKAIKMALGYIVNNPNLNQAQQQDLISNSWRINFKAKPPTPEEFITEKYLGMAADHTYPWVKKSFVEFMDPSKPYRNLILYPHIGWGKSYLSTIITLYIAACVNLMRNPWKYFGLNPATQLSQLLVSYSLKKSSELLLEPFISLLESSPFFERCQRMDQMQEAEAAYKNSNTIDKLYWTTAYKTSALGFSSGSTIKIASSPNGLLGLSIVSIVYSELAFFTDAGKSSDYIMKLYNDGKARVRSRLETSALDPDTGDKIVNYYGRTILDSSPNDLNNAIDDYIVNKSREDKTNYLIEGSRWKWRPDEYKKDFETNNLFKVYLGGRGNPARILEDNDPLLLEDSAARDKIITVPGSFRQVFKDDLKKALKDWAGIPTGSSNSLLYDYAPLERMFNKHMKNIYLNIEAPADMSPNGLIWDQIKDTFFINKSGRYEFYYKPHIPRCVSVDQSYATDVTSISMSHVERLGDTGELIYVVDFTIPILPTKKSNVNLEAIRCFLEDLRYKGGLRIEKISFDQFQSETTIQNLRREKFDVEKLSVDRSMDPYLNFISLVNTGRIVCGRNIFLKNNIKSLNVVRPKTSNGKTKIDHDNSREQILTGNENWEDSKIGFFGKDVSDSVCASIELCRLYCDYSDETWDPKYIQALTSRNKVSSDRKAVRNILKEKGWII